jgi:hypothetical protein
LAKLNQEKNKMATNDFLPFAVGSGANVLSQSDYAALSATATGYGSGVAQSAALNKTWRQSSIMAAVLAQFIANQTGTNSVDDGTTSTLLGNLFLATRATHGVARFTSSGSFIVPAGVTTLFISGCGGGGGGGAGGGGANTGYGAGGAGGSGGQPGVRAPVSVTPGMALNVVIGAAGAAGAKAGNGIGGGSGGSGGATTLTGSGFSTVTLVGGGGGNGGTNGSVNVSGGSPSGNTFPAGSYGNDGNGGSPCMGGAGASGPFGGGGGAGRGGAGNGIDGFPGAGFGAGGGGGGGIYTNNTGGTGGNGGAGVAGLLIIEW